MPKSSLHWQFIQAPTTLNIQCFLQLWTGPPPTRKGFPFHGPRPSVFARFLSRSLNASWLQASFSALTSAPSLCHSLTGRWSVWSSFTGHRQHQKISFRSSTCLLAQFSQTHLSQMMQVCTLALLSLTSAHSWIRLRKRVPRLQCSPCYFGVRKLTCRIQRYEPGSTKLDQRHKHPQ